MALNLGHLRLAKSETEGRLCRCFLFFLCGLLACRSGLFLFVVLALLCKSASKHVKLTETRDSWLLNNGLSRLGRCLVIDTFELTPIAGKSRLEVLKDPDSWCSSV